MQAHTISQQIRQEQASDQISPHHREQPLRAHQEGTYLILFTFPNYTHYYHFPTFPVYIVMQPQGKLQVTNEQAVTWIENHKKDLNPNEWRVRFYEKLGIEKAEQAEAETTSSLEREDRFENDKYYINFFSQRTEQSIRNRYLSRLMIDTKEERPRKKNQHIFIYDWDDTILCTTYLSSFQFLDIGPETKALLQKLDESSHRLLEHSLQRGEKIFIITNAAKGWVEYSSKLYLPRAYALLNANTIKIISARSMFGQEFPGDFARWKIEAFKSILSTTDTNLVTNLMCIGDSNIEIEAAHSLSHEFEHILVKTIKFRENPKPEELIKQQELVHDRMREIFESTKNLTIRLERKQSQNHTAQRTNNN